MLRLLHLQCLAMFLPVVGTFIAVIFNCSPRLQSILHLPARLWPRVRHVPARNLRRQRQGPCSCQRQSVTVDTWPRLSVKLQQSICCFQTFDTAALPPRIPAVLRFDAWFNFNLNIFYQINMHIPLPDTHLHTQAARQSYLSAISQEIIAVILAHTM